MYDILFIGIHSKLYNRRPQSIYIYTYKWYRIILTSSIVYKYQLIADLYVEQTNYRSAVLVITDCTF